MLKEKNVVNNVDRVEFKETMTRWSVQKQTEQHKTRNKTQQTPDSQLHM